MPFTEVGFFFRLKAKILLLFIAILVIPLSISMVVVMFRTETAAKSDFSWRLGYSASLFRESLSDQMTSMKIRAKTLADFDLYSFAALGFPATQTVPLMQNEIIRSGLDYMAIVVNGQETLCEEGAPPPDGLQRILISVCHSPLAANMFILNNEAWIFAAAEITKIRDRNRTHVVFALRLSRDFADRLKRLTNAEFSLIYAGRRIVTTLMDVYGKRMHESTPVNLDNKEGTMEVMGVGHRFVREEALRGVLSDTIFLEISLPSSEYTDLGKRISRDFLVFGALGVLLAIITGTILSLHIAGPLNRLAESTARIGAGDLSFEPLFERRDEIGVLQANFSGMVASLREEKDLKERRMRELSALFEVSNAVNYITDSEELLKFVLTSSIEVLNAERGSIMLLDDATDELMVKVASGGRFSVMTTTGIKIGFGICGKVVQEGKGRISNTGFRDDHFRNFGSLIPVEDIRTLLCSPLKFKDGTIGVINVVNKRNSEEFNENDLALLNLIASQAAVTIENNKLYELSITDGLTHLFVHRYFQARLAEELLRARRYGLKLSLIMIDVDNFKNFNDVYGHQIGDQVLQKVAVVVREAIRTQIDIPCRYGGEEMAVILPETRAEEAFKTAERLRESIAAMVISHPLGQLRITCSLGVASYPNDCHDVESLVMRADKAMYFSKRTGKNRSTLAGEIPETPEA